MPGVAAVLSINGGPLGDQIADPQNPLGRAFLELFQGYTIGADRQTTAVVCLLDSQAAVSQSQIVDRLRAIVEAHDPTGTIVGEPVMVVDGFRLLDADGRRLGRVSLVLLVAVIVLLFRSLRWVVVPLAVVMVSIVVTEGIISFSHWRLTIVSSMLSSIVTIIAIATVVHLIVHFRELRGAGLDPRDALVRTGTDLAAPIFWACATDAAGFGALIAAHVEPVHDFGWMMLIGSLVVLPALVAVVPGLALAGRRDADPRRAWGEGKLDLGLDRLSRWIELHPRRLWSVTALLTIVAAIGCSRLEVETDFTKNFRANSRVVRSYQFVEQHLGGAGVWDILVPAPNEIDWEFLNRLAGLERQLRGLRVVDEHGASQPGLTKVLSVADVLDAATLGKLPLLPLPDLRDRAVSEALAQMQSQMPEFYRALITRDPRKPSQSLVRVMLRSRERQESASKQQLISDVERASQAALRRDPSDRLFRAAHQLDPEHDERSVVDVRAVDRRDLVDDALRLSQPAVGGRGDRAQHAAGVHRQRAAGLARAEDQHGLGDDRGRVDGLVGRFVGPLHHGLSRAARLGPERARGAGCGEPECRPGDGLFDRGAGRGIFGPVLQPVRAHDLFRRSDGADYVRRPAGQSGDFATLAGGGAS